MFIEIIKELAKRGIQPSMDYCKETSQLVIDLNTKAKSQLYLYEDGRITGRYDYSSEINFDQPIEDIIKDLAVEFSEALWGRPYGNEEWFNLCISKNIKCETYI